RVRGRRGADLLRRRRSRGAPRLRRTHQHRPAPRPGGARGPARNRRLHLLGDRRRGRGEPEPRPTRAPGGQVQRAHRRRAAGRHLGHSRAGPRAEGADDGADHIWEESMLLPEPKERQRQGDPIKVGIVGAGQMGEGLVAQMEGMVGMRAFVVCDVVPGRATEVLISAGVKPDLIVETDDPDVGAQAVAEGRRVATTTPDVAWLAPVDITVEATGIPDVGAWVAYQAILHGRHVMQMNVEADATVGYLLRKMADSAGVVYTLTSGDEPGATMELYDFAASLGFEVICAGK